MKDLRDLKGWTIHDVQPTRINLKLPLCHSRTSVKSLVVARGGIAGYRGAVALFPFVLHLLCFPITMSDPKLYAPQDGLLSALLFFFITLRPIVE